MVLADLGRGLYVADVHTMDGRPAREQLQPRVLELLRTELNRTIMPPSLARHGEMDVMIRPAMTFETLEEREAQPVLRVTVRRRTTVELERHRDYLVRALLIPAEVATGFDELRRVLEAGSEEARLDAEAHCAACGADCRGLKAVVGAERAPQRVLCLPCAARGVEADTVAVDAAEPRRSPRHHAEDQQLLNLHQHHQNALRTEPMPLSDAGWRRLRELLEKRFS